MNHLSRKTLTKWFERECITRGFDPTTFDFEAIVDSTLTYGENKAILLEELGGAPSAEEAAFGEYEERIAKLEAENDRLRKREARRKARTSPIEQIRELCRILELTLTIEKKTWEFYRRLSHRSSTLLGTIPALVYLAGRNHGMALSPREVAELAFMDRKTFSHRYLCLAKELDLRYRPLDPRELLTNARKRLSLPEKVIERTRVILEDYVPKRGCGKSPRSTMVAAVHIAMVDSGIRMSLHRLSNVLGASPSTVRDRHMEMKAFLGR